MTEPRTNKVDVQAEFDEKQQLHYPARPFAVWMNGTMVVPAAYLMDQHTFSRSVRAISQAHAWAAKEPGNQAIVYQRQTGTILAHFLQAMDGERGCQIYHPDGHRVWSTAAHLFATVPDECWQQKRSLVFQTMVPTEQTELLLPWRNYWAARRKLVRALRERGMPTQPHASLAELLTRVRLLLRDDNRLAPESPYGEVLFDPDIPYYDVSLLKVVLLALAPCLERGSTFVATWCGKRVRIGFKQWIFDSQWALTVTEREEKEQDGKQTPAVVFTLAHPEGDQVEIHALPEWETLALDVLLWRLLFEVDSGEYASGAALGADFDARTSFIAQTVDLVVPAPGASEQLLALIALEPRFFSADLRIPRQEMSAAGLVYAHARSHIEELYRSHWYKVIKQVRHLTC